MTLMKSLGPLETGDLKEDCNRQEIYFMSFRKAMTRRRNFATRKKSMTRKNNATKRNSIIKKNTTTRKKLCN